MKCLYMHIEIQRKIFGVLNFLHLNIVQNYLFLQYHIGIKYTDRIVSPSHKDILMFQSNISNISGTIVNKYQNNIYLSEITLCNSLRKEKSMTE